VEFVEYLCWPRNCYWLKADRQQAVGSGAGQRVVVGRFMAGDKLAWNG